MLKKNLLIAVAALGLSASAFAANGAPDIYVGALAGYGDTNWANLDGGTSSLDPFGNVTTTSINFKDQGFAAGALAGYDINQYIAVEGGYVYFPKTKISTTQTVTNANFYNMAGSQSVTTGFNDSINTYGLDLLAKITVPVVDNFGLFAKAGPGYLHSSASDAVNGGSVGRADLVYGFGAQYQFMPNLVADVSFTRFNGHQKLDNDYQPNADLIAAGLSYKFNI